MKTMIRYLAALCAAAVMMSGAVAQSSCPSIRHGVVLTAAQWDACFAAKQDTLGFTPISASGGTMQGELVTAASTTNTAGLNLAPGVAPTSPVNGDLWSTSTGIYARVNGSTVDLTGTLAVQNANKVWAGPTTGADAAPTFRALVAADLPTNAIGLTSLAQSGANTILGNWTGSAANVVANAIPSCPDSGNNHLNYVSGTGIICGTTAPSGSYLPTTGGTLTGALLFTDNTYDIGASGATRPRTGYFGTSIVSPAVTLGTQQTVQGSLVLANTAAAAYSTTVKSSNSATAAWTLTLPTTAGTSGYVLSTNGSGVTSWINPNALGVATATSINGNAISTGTGTLTLSSYTLSVTGAASISGTHTGTSSGTNTGDQTLPTWASLGGGTMGQRNVIIQSGGTCSGGSNGDICIIY